MERAIRVPAAIGAWVRQQPGSVTETVLALTEDVYRRRQIVTLPDPGPGEDRLKFRLAPRVLAFVRKATHSRESTAGVRKLLLWGFEGRDLPRSPSYSCPLPLPATYDTPSVPPMRPDSEASQAIALRYRENPLIAQRTVAVELSRKAERWFGRPGASEAFSAEGAGVAKREAEVVGAPSPLTFSELVVVVGSLALVLICGYYVVKWVSGAFSSAGELVADMTKATPEIAAWTPQAAAGLGALFL